MRQEIELYLGGKSVEFAEPPEILFSYIRTDYTDPTVLRNSYSKTLNIEGTPNNNALFNGIYHLDKISDYGTFNPAKRMEFQLFSNGDILEQGYAKLDKINKEGKNISYDITLYGGLGEFLYNLSYDQTAEGSDTSRGGGEDRRLSSLIYYDDDNPNTEFDFNITRDTVAEAWEALEKGTGATMWQYINFAPAYNGFPENFDADKVLINTQNSSCPVTYNNNGETGTSTGFPTSIKQGDSTYRAYNNYAIGELPKEMTEYEMRDLRSYLQRPVLSMKGFINAISNPANNGGYNVVLDSSFFNDNNPYYSKAWFTLPLLHKDETVTGQAAKTEVANDVLSISSSMGESYDTRYYLQGLQPGAVYQGIELNFQFNVDVSGMPNQIMTTAFDYKAGGLFARDAGYYSSIFVQMIGEDENGNAIAGSPIYNFTSPYGEEEGLKIIIGNQWEGPQDLYCDRKFFDSAYTPVLETSDVNVLGRFVKSSGNHYVWKNINGDVVTLTAKLDDRFEYHRIYFRVTKVMRWRDYKRNGNPNFNRFEDRIFSGLTGNGVRENILMGWVSNQAWLGGDWGLSAKTATTQVSVVGSQAKYTVASDVVRSGDHISKGDLLNFDGTPCDYLLSYCKLFNLFLSKDTYEKKIYIRTRDSFYNGGTIDLDKFIDRSKDIKVSPLAMDSRWYDFAYPEEEKCGAAEDYDFNYGVEYGKNKVQTTYEFDSAARDLFEDNIFQNGVQVQESSKYFTLRTINNGRGKKTVPTFLYNAIEYKLFNSPNDAISSCVILPPSGFTQDGYTSADGKEDWMPKLQLNNDNKSIDGQNVLCFYGGFKTSPYIGGQQVIYYLTDDLAEMYVLNGETPCWLWTKTEKNGEQTIAKGMTKLPIFSRMLYSTENTTGVTDTKISYTWDFGRVRNTYVPIKSYVDKATIYERWWANYIADLYDYNTRVVEAYVKMEGKVVGDWLRAFYWWDNCYWVLTEINDYNITSYNTTKCKFVKVNDISNYTSGSTPPQPSMPIATLVPSKYMIAASGETITAVVKTSDGGSWHLEYPSYVHPSQVAGTGDTTITLRFDANPNSDGRDFNVSGFRTVGTPTHFWQEGTDTTDKELTLNGFEGNGGLIFDYSAQTFNTLTITYRNRGSNTVTISGAPAWLTPTLSQWNGETAILTLSLANNSGTTVRSATITLSAPGASSKTIKIDQLPQYYDISNNGGSVSDTLTNDFEVTVVQPYVAAFWADIEVVNHKTVIFSAPANVEEETRYQTVNFVTKTEGYELITSGNAIVRQNGGGGQLIVTPTAITAEWSGGDKYIVVTAMTNWEITSAPEWVNLSATAGTSGQTIIVASFPTYSGTSARTGNIVFSDGVRSATTVITQNANTQSRISASPASLYFNYTGGTQYVSVMAPYNSWTVTSKPDWVVLSQTSGGLGYYMVGVTAPNYMGNINRTGDIVFQDTATSASVSTQIFQTSPSSVPSIVFVPSAITANNCGGTYQITINYGNRNGDEVTFATTDNWVSVGPVTWSGESGTATVTVNNYGVNQERVATITASGVLNPVSETLNVTQKAYLTYTPSSITYEFVGGSANFSVTAECPYTIERGSGTWYFINPQSGESGVTLFTVLSNTVNTSDSAWTDNINIIGPSGDTAGIIAITEEHQGTRHIAYTADTSTVAASGETRVITIDSTDFINSSITVTIIGAPGASYSYEQSGLTRGLITVNFPENTSIPRNVTVVVRGRIALSSNEASSVIVFPQAEYITVAIPYTADTSNVESTGETRTITIDTSGLVESSITATASGATGVTTSYNNGVVTVVFPINYEDEKNIDITIRGKRTNGDNGLAVVTYTQEKLPLIDIPYTADTSTIAATGETRTIIIDTTGLVESSITIDIGTATGVSYSYQNGVVTLYFGENSGLTRDFLITITAVTSTRMPAKAEVYFRQKADRRYYITEPLTFYITRPGKIYWSTNSSSIFSKTIQYQKNDGEWTNISTYLSSTTQSIDVVQGDIVKFKGDNIAYSEGAQGVNSAGFRNSTAEFEVCGNIMSLINSTGFTGETAYVSNFTFNFLFADCSDLTGAEDLITDATGLTPYCYANLFNSCSRLKSAPELPATTAAAGCYSGMFRNCSSLTTAPELPATTLEYYCYTEMFRGCTSLTTAPELPATILANDCYYFMFASCVSLTTAPELPARRLAGNCYYYMFSGCTSLTTAPELPATTLAHNCYGHMFYGCRSLTKAPLLPATTLANYCYDSMFSGCTSLNCINCLATDTAATSCTANWVKNVASAGTFFKNPNMTGWTTGVNGIPVNWITQDYEWMLTAHTISFPLNTSSKQITVYSTTDWTAHTTDNWITLSQLSGASGETVITVTVNAASGIDEREGKIKFISINNEDTLRVVQSYLDLSKPLTFDIISSGSIHWQTSNASQGKTIQYKKNDGEWTNITSTTAGALISVVSGDTVQFRGDNPSYRYNHFGLGCECKAEGNIMSLINSTGFVEETALTADYAFYGLFSEGGITDISSLALPAEKLTSNCYNSMFRSCTGLTNAPELPATNLSGANYCYNGMFYGCTSLTTAPELPATTLAEYCYGNMFAGCISLTSAPVLSATTLVSECYRAMFSNCTSLTTAPELPATTLAQYCYQGMFSGCTSLTTAPSILPALTLDRFCYHSMFSGCTSLTTAPELPAETLVDYCYQSMFYGCASLNYIKCLATTMTVTYGTDDWVKGVASTGTFVKDATANWSVFRDYDGIPRNWTVVDA